MGESEDRMAERRDADATMPPPARALRQRARWGLLSAPLVVVLALLVGGAAASGASARRGPLVNPPTNIGAPALLTSSGRCTQSPGGDFVCESPCFPTLKAQFDDSSGCTAVALSGVNRGRRSEHLPPMALPGNYAALSTAQQLFVLVNLERTARGVPPLLGLTPALSANAQHAAVRSRDPDVKSAYGALHVGVVGNVLGIGGAWAGQTPNPVGALFGWMYDDGWGGAGHTFNLACTSPTADGCWGHRDELLGNTAGSPARSAWRAPGSRSTRRPTGSPPTPSCWSRPPAPNRP